MAIELPIGFRVAGVHCGLKTNDQNQDLTMMVSDRECVAAGVYTQNQVVAAPVTLDQQRTPSSRIRAVVANSGNANACTGTRGATDAATMSKLAADEINASDDQVLVLSTGIIGEHLPMDKIAIGIRGAASQLGREHGAIVSAARALMTTDTHPKIAFRELELDGSRIRLLGMAKGAAMIGPRMATMLGVVLTDANLPTESAQSGLRSAVDVSFNCISVEGHMSTNDTVLLLANGAAKGGQLESIELEKFNRALTDLCVELARSIPADGEGATHLIEIEVGECASQNDAYRIAKSIAESALVKTAVAGADPNWGRIVSAAGYSGVSFDPSTVHLSLNGVSLYEQGQPIPFDEAAVADSIRNNRETQIHFRLGQGSERIRFWTCDLTAEYVRLNADYHT